MRKILIACIILTFLIMPFALYRAFGETRKAAILFMEGDVKVKKAGSTQWVAAKEDMTLSEGDSVKTGANSWVEIGLGENYENVVRVKENTVVKITDLGPVEINLLQGELRALIESLDKDETFRVRTAVSVCGVRGTGWDKKTDGKTASVDVYEDAVYFSGVPQQGKGMHSIVKSGKSAMLEDPAKPIKIKDLPPDKLRDWKKWKREFTQRRDAKRGSKGKTGPSGGIENMLKGKQNMFEKRDQDFIDNKRLGTSSESGGYEE